MCITCSAVFGVISQMACLHLIIVWFKVFTYTYSISLNAFMFVYLFIYFQKWVTVDLEPIPRKLGVK